MTKMSLFTVIQVGLRICRLSEYLVKIGRLVHASFRLLVLSQISGIVFHCYLGNAVLVEFLYLTSIIQTEIRVVRCIARTSDFCLEFLLYKSHTYAQITNYHRAKICKILTIFICFYLW